MESIAEKRFPATPKRRQEARKKGQVLKSQELTSAIMLLVMIGVLRLWLPVIFERMASLTNYVVSLSFEWNSYRVADLMTTICWESLLLLGPLFIAAVVAGFAVNYVQVGALFTVEPLKPKLSKLSPIEGVKRMFGVKAWVQLLKSLLKVTIIGYFMFDVIRDNLQIYPALLKIDVGQAVVLLGGILFQMAWKVALAFVLVAVLDFLYQWWEYEKNLKMSHEEIKEEYKQTEGDPYLKSEIKKKQRSLAMRRMMEDLKEADVVITNPTHYAVALKYDPRMFEAPYVVAKGQGEIALRIKALAVEHDIVVMENRNLARTLYSQTELGQAVPVDLYNAVAEVLAFVYRLNKGRKKAGTAGY